MEKHICWDWRERLYFCIWPWSCRKKEAFNCVARADMHILNFWWTCGKAKIFLCMFGPHEMLRWQLCQGTALIKIHLHFTLKKTKMSLWSTTAGEEAVMIAPLPFVMTPFVIETEAARAVQFWDLCVSVCYSGNEMIEELVCAEVPQRAQILPSTTNIYLFV